jgi:predicted phosphatase
MKMTKPLLFCDFDGVLAIPYTNPVELYPNIPDLLRQLSHSYTLCLASFNPTALDELKRFDLLSLFVAVRAGRHELHHMSSIHEPLCKVAQIRSMYNEMGVEFQTLDTRVWFVDDTISHIENVRKNLTGIQCVWVDSTTGLTMGHFDG